MADALQALADRGHPAAADLTKRAAKMRACSKKLTLTDEVDPEGNVRRRAKATYRCNLRNCITCEAVHRQRMIERIFRVFAKAFEDLPTLKVLVLTLTVPNVPPDLLGPTIDRMNRQFGRMVEKEQRWRDAVLGYVKALEVTWSAKTSTAHPHFHVLLVVDGRTYGPKHHDQYIPFEEWRAMWSKYYGVDDLIVRINRKGGREVDGQFGKAVKHALKYPWAMAEFTTETANGYVVDPDVLEAFHNGLKGRRTFAFGGMLKAIDVEQRKESSTEDQLIAEGDVADDWLLPPETSMAIPVEQLDDILAFSTVVYRPGMMFHRPEYVPDQTSQQNQTPPDNATSESGSAL